MDDQSKSISDGERVRCGLCGGSGSDPFCPVCDPSSDPAAEPSDVRRHAITVPTTCRVTSIVFRGVRQPVEPPVELHAGDEIIIEHVLVAPESHGQRRMT